MAPSGGGNIKVVVRVRPFNGRGNDTPTPGPLTWRCCEKTADLLALRTGSTGEMYRSDEGNANDPDSATR